MLRPSITKSLFLAICSYKVGYDGYLDNFKTVSILTLTFDCGFSCGLGLEKLRKMPQYNYVAIKLPLLFLQLYEDLLYFALCMGVSTRDLHLPERITKDLMIKPTQSYTSSFPDNSLILPSFRETIVTLLYILFCLYLHCNLGKK